MYEAPCLPLLVAVLLLLAPPPARCQQGQLAGHVITSEKDEGFPGATLTLQQAGKIVTGTITDTNGAFSFVDLPLGTYKVVLKMIGYRRKSQADIQVTAQPTAIMLSFPGRCRSRYSLHHLPTCVGGHTDQFFPSSTGFPARARYSGLRQGKLYLGGAR